MHVVHAGFVACRNRSMAVSANPWCNKACWRWALLERNCNGAMVARARWQLVVKRIVALLSAGGDSRAEHNV